MNIFEIATREKYRFSFMGLISVEDLWDLKEDSLDQIYRELNSQKRKDEEESLLTVKTAADDALDIKIQIVKYIFEKKREEALVRLQKAENAQKRHRIQELIASKQDAVLQEKSVEELQKMLEELA